MLKIVLLNSGHYAFCGEKLANNEDVTTILGETKDCNLAINLVTALNENEISESDLFKFLK